MMTTAERATVLATYRKAVANTPYRPGNGMEGRMFDADWCDRCKRDAAFRTGGCEVAEDGCGIVADALCYDIDHPNYPPQWVHDAEGDPMCTAFEEIGP